MRQEIDAETREIVCDSFRKLLTEYGFPSVETPKKSSDHSSPSSIWARLAELGLLGLLDKEENGGLDGDVLTICSLMEDVGRHLFPEPLWDTAVISAGLLRKYGCAEELEAIANGQFVVALGFSLENLRCHSEVRICSATQRGSNWVLNGECKLVRYGPKATHILVAAKMKDQRTGLFILPASEAIERRDYVMLDRVPAADFVLRDLEVDARSLLATADDWFESVGEFAGYMAVYLCSEAIGILDELVARTASFVKERTQFGKTLAEFQAVRHTLARMAIEREQIKSLQSMAIAHGMDIRSVSALMFRTAKALRLVGQSAIQLHGGIGTTEEFIIGGFVRRALVIERQFGTAEAHLEQYERERWVDWNEEGNISNFERLAAG